MALFLTEDVMRQYLLSEAPKDKAPEDEDDKDAEPDEKASPDNKDKADEEEDAEDTEEEDTEEPEEGGDAAGPPSDDDFGSGDADSGTEEEPADGEEENPNAAPVSQILQSAVAKQGIEIPDSVHNRTWLLEKYQEVIKIYENLLEFVGTLSSRFPNDGKRVQILNHMTAKIESNLEMLNKALDDQIFVNMDVAALFALYKIYFNDASSISKTIKLIVSYQNVK